MKKTLIFTLLVAFAIALTFDSGFAESNTKYSAISDLKEITSEEFFYGVANEAVIDSYGYSYESPILFDGTSSFVMYYSAGKYNVLQGTIASNNTMPSDYCMNLSIYADDTLIYSLSSITRLTPATSISLDIQDAQRVKIETDGNINYRDGVGIIAQLFVSESPCDTPAPEFSMEYLDSMNVADLKLVDSNFDFHGVEDSLVIDTYGNTYSHVVLLGGDSLTVKYYTAGLYSNLSGIIAANDEMPKDYKQKVSIFADEKKVYTCNVDRVTMPESIMVDITGAQLITIKSSGNINYDKGLGAILDLSTSK